MAVRWDFEGELGVRCPSCGCDVTRVADTPEGLYQCFKCLAYFDDEEEES